VGFWERYKEEGLQSVNLRGRFTKRGVSKKLLGRDFKGRTSSRRPNRWFTVFKIKSLTVDSNVRQ
jgi:hypothetical protein